MNMKLIDAPSAFTGEIPSEWIGSDFGGRDDYTLRDWSFSGAGLDAPVLVPAGGHTNRNFDQVPFSMFAGR